MKPVAATERIMLLDVLRGFAIFGMFSVNMTADLPWGDTFLEQILATPDRVVMILVDLLARGRFVTIFSLLFGLGFYVQLERAQARGEEFAVTYLRRVLGLFMIAAVATVAGLDTDVLIDYAMFGALLLLFYKRSQRFLLLSVIICFLAAQAPGFVEYYRSLDGQVTVVAQMEQSDQLSATSEKSVQPDVATDEDLEKAEPTRIYREGSFVQIAKHRASRFLKYVKSFEQRLRDIDILGLLLLGVYVARRGVLSDPEVRREFARRALPWLLSIGSAGVLAFVVIEHFLSAAWDSEPLLLVKWAIGWPMMVVLGLGYAAGITLLLERDNWRKLFSPLASVGRLALTNYLFTTLVFAVIAYSWGLGLYEKVQPFTGLVVVLLVFPMQVLASQWWLRHFNFGPFEWCWRSMTYGRLPPIRRT